MKRQDRIFWTSVQQYVDPPNSGWKSVWELWEICFHAWYCHIQLGKHFAPATCCNEECVAPQTTHQMVLLGKKSKRLLKVSLYCRHSDVTEGTFKGRRRRKERRFGWLSGWVYRNLTWRVIPSWFLPCSFPTLTKLGSWDAPSFCRLIFHLWWHLLRSICCLSPARSWEMLKSIYVHEAFEERERPVVSQREENAVSRASEGQRGVQSQPCRKSLLFGGHINTGSPGLLTL